MTEPKKILLFSTLNPYPFWAGSENLWFDFVRDERIKNKISFHVMLAKSPVTQDKAMVLAKSKVIVEFYNHFNNHLIKRNSYKLFDKIVRRDLRTLPWYDTIKKHKFDLILFNVAGINDLLELAYAIQICKKNSIPYWLLLQQANEIFFLTNDRDLKTFTDVALSAKRFLFISKQNAHTVERAIGESLKNAFFTQNAIPLTRIEKAMKLGQAHPVNADSKARFFNLGRFSPLEKGQHLLLQAFAEKNWESRNWELTYIGVSDFGKLYLNKLIRFYKLDPSRIKIIGQIDNVFAEIVEHDVLLMPSLMEGTPFAMIESMACGRPAMGTPVGGILELIRNNETGWLCANMGINDIVEKLEEVWHQRADWVKFGMNAQKLILNKYNQESVFEELLTALMADV